uniref:Uncharacterized protein n=1 Tax=Opuntia streptacantha TaxID=393608 RepID=A0A7C9DS65_OPUST
MHFADTVQPNNSTINKDYVIPNNTIPSPTVNISVSHLNHFTSDFLHDPPTLPVISPFCFASSFSNQITKLNIHICKTVSHLKIDLADPGSYITMVRNIVED